MFLICWDKDDQRNWEKCHYAKEIEDVLVRNKLTEEDSVFCLSCGVDGCPMSYPQLLQAAQGELPIKGSFVRTPRFLNVMLEEVFPDALAANIAGYREPTHFKSDYFHVLGKGLGDNCMSFAAALKPAAK